MRQRRFTYLAVSLFTVVVFLIFYYTGIVNSLIEKPGVPLADTPIQCERQFHTLVSRSRQCLVQQVSNMIFAPDKLYCLEALDSVVEKCMDKNFMKLLDVHTLYYKEVKWYILPRETVHVPCTVVTLGIGGIIKSERQLKKHLPHCKFYGADPVAENGNVYREIGTSFKVAVAAESGQKQALILENGKLRFSDVETIEFLDFLQTWAKIDRIDYFWLDNEGGEFEIIPKYLIKPNITICQMMIETHSPTKMFDGAVTEYQAFFTDLLEKSPFLLIQAKSNLCTFLLINVEDPYCLEKYYLPKVCSIPN